MYKQCTNKTSISVRMCNKKETRSKLAANQVFLDRSRWFRKSARSCDCQYICDFVQIAYEFS